MATVDNELYFSKTNPDRKIRSMYLSFSAFLFLFSNYYHNHEKEDIIIVSIIYQKVGLNLLVVVLCVKKSNHGAGLFF